ncbi:MAG TPA: FAD-dependent oxidoreductase [Bacteroidales bacterium]|nr:FAD-dependent oxidoreductase [Bacteroidales bacterium]HPJ60299.1 FAD-dependent oxidoreductase [Bacteroidales bacterium]HPR13461.1 FAD-dependent oxidoreductase [Bacteroidales bacterium]HRW86269.1 FAD-dependent oxidoreductase [Bacteroidales bacterium]
MPHQVNLNLDPPTAADEAAIRKLCAQALRKIPSDISGIRILKRSVDARQRNIKVNLTVEVFTGGEEQGQIVSPYEPKDVTRKKEVIIIGAGPAGLFAALRLIELGVRPVIIERGREVSARKRDIARISREHIIDADSNYCFGEGGAGTFSDGKLYTRSKKRGDNTRVLELLYLHGANENILYEAHSHLGTDKLPAIISGIRQTITDAGGLVLFEKRVTDILPEAGNIRGVVLSGGEQVISPNVILATGHSARDIYEICRMRSIELEMKSFAMGVRVEHPQELIDSIQYHGNQRGKYLPAASYSLVHQADGRGVYSFCMCPGGFIVPSATSQEEVVVNGMSPSGRNSPYANSGMVVEIRPEDLAEYSASGVLAGLEFQRELEHESWIRGGKTQRAPAQRLQDFVNGKASSSLPAASYFPGITSSPVHEWLPDHIAGRLREGLKQFGTKMKGFLTNEAVVLGVESRTSSPVRIPRNSGTMEHIKIKGLYPCGEGSGYAGGIVSSAVDGMRAAEAVAGLRGKL